MTDTAPETQVPAEQAPVQEPEVPPAQEPSQAQEPPAPQEPEETPKLTIEDLDLPDGADPKDPLLVSFVEEANKLGLGPDSAKAMLDLHKKALKAQYEQFNKTRFEWQAELKQEYGEKLTDELSQIATALQEFAPDHIQAFQEIMNTSGLGDNPVVFKVMSALAKAAVGGALVKGKPADPSKPPIAERWFGDNSKGE